MLILVSFFASNLVNMRLHIFQISVYESDKKKYFLFSSQLDQVVDTYIHALFSKRPRFHYCVGTAAKLVTFQKWILPDEVANIIFSKIGANSLLNPTN